MTLIKVILFFILSMPVFAIEINEIILDSKITDMKKAGVGPVRYPHKFHEGIYKCAHCHPGIFIEKIGSNDINMQKNIEEKYCGNAGCHNSAYAFPLYLCDNCHTKLKETPGK